MRQGGRFETTTAPPRCPSAGGGDAASEQEDDKAGNDAEAWEEETGSASFRMGIHDGDPGVGRVRRTLSVALGTSPARGKVHKQTAKVEHLRPHHRS
jgi:hypothetical protein